MRIHSRAHTIINLCTLSPLQPSRVCLPVCPRKPTALGLCVCACVHVCECTQAHAHVHMHTSNVCAQIRKKKVDEWSSNQFPTDRCNTAPHNCLQIEKAVPSKREKRHKNKSCFNRDRFSQFGFKINSLLTMSVDKREAALPW